ncbi:LysR family transcriptional regulator [Pseudomonas mendocina]|nr:LysR family transcriptional regulator [Pseudomonas mendocina]
MIGSFHFGHAIRHLLCLVEIACQRSFAKAADALAVSQPAIARALRR